MINLTLSKSLKKNFETYRPYYILREKHADAYFDPYFRSNPKLKLDSFKENIRGMFYGLINNIKRSINKELNQL